MSYLAIRNFGAHQHYKQRNPPWVKLYCKILDDEEIRAWSVPTRLLALLLLCVAARKDNRFTADVSWLSVEVGLPRRVIAQSLEELLAEGFLMPASAIASDGASEPSSKSAIEQTETETEPPPIVPPLTNSARKPDELWDALTAELGEAKTKSERGQRNKARKELHDIGATAEDIRLRCAQYRRTWPQLTLSDIALVKHWSRMAPVETPASPPVEEVLNLPEADIAANLEHVRELAGAIGKDVA